MNMLWFDSQNSETLAKPQGQTMYKNISLHNSAIYSTVSTIDWN